ncbi:MAG: GNAT family N-acetyltransferase [Caldilineaceae bacterium]
MDHFTYGESQAALTVMRHSAEHLIKTGKALWPLERLTETIFHGLAPEEIIVGYADSTPIAAMLLMFQDGEFWPQVQAGESRFVHKLAVAPAYKGQGIGHLMLAKAVLDAKAQSASYVRLDCAGDRPQLRQFYESFGFRKVKTQMVGPYFTAFYELKLA